MENELMLNYVSKFFEVFILFIKKTFFKFKKYIKENFNFYSTLS